MHRWMVIELSRAPSRLRREQEMTGTSAGGRERQDVPYHRERPSWTGASSCRMTPPNHVDYSLPLNEERRKKLLNNLMKYNTSSLIQWLNTSATAKRERIVCCTWFPVSTRVADNSLHSCRSTVAATVSKWQVYWVPFVTIYIFAHNDRPNIIWTWQACVKCGTMDKDI